MKDESAHATALAMSPEEFALWANAPAGQVFFSYLAERIAEFREAAADMVQLGTFDFGPSPHPNRNPHLIGGELRAYDHLARITLPVIQDHYREAQAGEADSDRDQRHPSQGTE